jgi:hypothetical protein
MSYHEVTGFREENRDIEKLAILFFLDEREICSDSKRPWTVSDSQLGELCS